MKAGDLAFATLPPEAEDILKETEARLKRETGISVCLLAYESAQGKK